MKIYLVLCSSLIALVASTPLGAKPGPRIILGEDAERRQFPYMVSLHSYGGHNCGGGILSPTWVVTAAHCFAFPENVEVYAGLLDQGEDHPDIQRVTVEKVVPHPNYIGLYDDIALLKLSSPLVFNAAVQPIKVPHEDYVVGGDVTLAGWGRISVVPSEYATRLQWLVMPIISNDDCNRIFAESPVNYYNVIETMVCTLPRVVEQSGCHGDSGSPLVQDGLVVGVVKGGHGGCGHGLAASSPNVFTRITPYVDFIEENVDDLPDK